MIAAAVLMLFVIVYRVVLGISGSTQMDWWHNFSPLAAIALCGATYFPRRLALVVPMLTLQILPRYLALALIAGFGWLLRDNPRPSFVLGSSLAASVLFFIVTNTGSWLAEPAYAPTAAGWTQAMTTGLPGYPSTLFFFRNTLLSDLLFTGLFLACIAIRGEQPPPAARHELAQW